MSEQTLLPHEPWYDSPVQVRLVVASALQVLSMLLRITSHYTQLSSELIETIMADAADLGQGLALIVGVLAIIKRQQSKVAPLTLTVAGAERKTAANPPLLDSDPTKSKIGANNA